ncbi:S-adenosyl-L-methionine-dependent methyltransferase [Epithele typhae]|uniref:S-adenosyl-L-methionine-dependent methyltransferase n=1 Tax=Epithele typhae TaxID=378194 RepID=UPI002007649D|nr:S-adenosyl-L-methionine-dependent methyltransferase [Epithele typhae]KAH9912255.1 S-adenosyl-L-methionine-dependent methyltransferase [Epithele typhae]
MLPTPDLSHLKSEDYRHVYEPAEDTFILLDALEEDAETLRELRPAVCVEIGSGSGCVTTFAGKILGASSSLYLTTDINPRACATTKATGCQNTVPIEPILASLVGPLRARLKHAVDLLLFNPPYVPTDAEEADAAQDDAGIAGAWAGGQDGMAITDVVLDQVENLLSPRGRFYLVAVKQNDIQGICGRMLTQHGLRGEVALQRRAGREHLYVLRFHRERPDRT